MHSGKGVTVLAIAFFTGAGIHAHPAIPNEDSFRVLTCLNRLNDTGYLGHGEERKWQGLVCVIHSGTTTWYKDTCSCPCNSSEIPVSKTITSSYNGFPVWWASHPTDSITSGASGYRYEDPSTSYYTYIGTPIYGTPISYKTTSSRPQTTTSAPSGSSEDPVWWASHPTNSLKTRTSIWYAGPSTSYYYYPGTPISYKTTSCPVATASDFVASVERPKFSESTTLPTPTTSPDHAVSSAAYPSEPTTDLSGTTHSGHSNGLEHDTPTSVTFGLTNWRDSNDVWAYVFGLNADNQFVFANPADPATFLYPSTNPDGSNTAIPNDDIGFRLGGYNETIKVTVPHWIAGGRIYISQGQMQFFANGNPHTGAKGVVTPASANPNDPNHATDYTFLEFAWNSANFVINPSAVDMVGLPAGLDIPDSNGGPNHVIKGMKSTAVRDICAGLTAQSALDGSDWAKGCIYLPGQTAPHRAIAPKQYLGNGAFANYLAPLHRRVRAHYASRPLYINAANSLIPCRLHGDSFHCPGTSHPWDFPSEPDFFGCAGAEGAFKVAPDSLDGLVAPIMCAAWNRGTLLAPPHSSATLHDGTPCHGGIQPCLPPSAYYPPGGVYNHWNRIVHENEWEGIGYAFAYDDASSPNGEGRRFGGDSAGVIFVGRPGVARINVGGYDLAPAGYQWGL